MLSCLIQRGQDQGITVETCLDRQLAELRAEVVSGLVETIDRHEFGFESPRQKIRALEFPVQPATARPRSDP